MSQELWEKTHQARAWGKYPDVDVVRLLMRHFPPREIREKISILDLGCGAGANSLMFLEEGFKAHGIDFSPAAIERIGSSLVEKKLECHQNSFIVGDFKRLPWNDNFFDVVVDLYDRGYRSIKMVAGSDRIKEFEGLLTKYNGVKGRHGFYNFKNIQVVSAGERDPDAEGIAGMSASKMRAMAFDGDEKGFISALPKTFRLYARRT